MLAAIQPRAEGEVFNIGTGIETSVDDLVRYVGRPRTGAMGPLAGAPGDRARRLGRVAGVTNGGLVRRWGRPVAVGTGRWSGVIRAADRMVPLGAGAALLVLLAVEVRVVAMYDGLSLWAGFDYRTYMDATARWLAGGPFYEPYQLAGPYTVVAHEILYPPVALALFAPLSVLPAVLWWAIPLGILAAVVISWRPGRWAWVSILACLVLPNTIGVSWAINVVVNGNPGIWVAAVLAVGTRWPAAAPWVLAKPTLLPFALLHIRRRAWWAGLAVFALAAVIFLPMWPDYLRVVTNARSAEPAWTYSLGSVPLMLVPLVAWLGRSDRVAEACVTGRCH